MSERILLVEDNESVREVVWACLSLAGYDVAQAIDGREALQQLDRLHPDLVLLDVRLPDISGWDVLSMMQHSGIHQDVPVVMLTGLQDDASKAYAWQNGCTYYLAKPIDLQDLLLVVRKLVSCRELVAPVSEAVGPQN